MVVVYRDEWCNTVMIQTTTWVARYVYPENISSECVALLYFADRYLVESNLYYADLSQIPIFLVQKTDSLSSYFCWAVQAVFSVSVVSVTKCNSIPAGLETDWSSVKPGGDMSTVLSAAL